MMELWEGIDGLWKYLGEGEEVKRLREDARDIEGKVSHYKKEAEDLFRKQHEESARYFNTAMAVGYAGYFATWTLTRNYIDKWHSSFIGLMGIFSLAIFICWELFMMHIRMRNLANLNTFFRDMISVHDFEPMRQKQLNKETQMMLFVRPIWALVFSLSAGAAAVGGFDLMIQLYKNL